MKTLKWIAHEIKMQWKNGLYILYIFINLFYILLLSYVPGQFKEMITTVLIVSDPTFVGMIFAGGIFLLERNQGIPKGIGVSPLGSIGYISGKVVSLLLIAMITSLCLMKAGNMPFTVSSVLGIAITSGLFTCIGLIVGCFSKSMNHFIFLLVVVAIPLALPVLAYLFAPHFIGFIWSPTYATIKLLSKSGRSMVETMSYILYLIVWAVLCISLTKKIVEERVFVS